MDRGHACLFEMAYRGIPLCLFGNVLAELSCFRDGSTSYTLQTIPVLASVATTAERFGKVSASVSTWKDAKKGCFARLQPDVTRHIARSTGVHKANSGALMFYGWMAYRHVCCPLARRMAFFRKKVGSIDDSENTSSTSSHSLSSIAKPYSSNKLSFGLRP